MGRFEMASKSTKLGENVPATVSNHHTNGVAPAKKPANLLTPLGEKIFLDRYALKDAKKSSVTVGDTVIVAVNLETGQREIGTVTEMKAGQLTIRLRDGETVQRALENIDKPLETR